MNGCLCGAKERMKLRGQARGEINRRQKLGELVKMREMEGEGHSMGGQRGFIGKSGRALCHVWCQGARAPRRTGSTIVVSTTGCDVSSLKTKQGSSSSLYAQQALKLPYFLSISVQFSSVQFSSVYH